MAGAEPMSRNLQVLQPEKRATGGAPTCCCLDGRGRQLGFYSRCDQRVWGVLSSDTSFRKFPLAAV